MHSELNFEKRIRIAANMIVAVATLITMIFSCTYFALAEDNGLPQDYQPKESDNRELSDNTGQNRYGIPWHQYKNVLTSETVNAQDITVVCEPDDDWSDPEPVAGMSFRLYNSTTQETEAVVTTDGAGILHLPYLKRGHTYILMADSDSYIIEGSRNIYLWALRKGDENVSADGAYEHKTGYVRLNDDDPAPTPDSYLKRVSEITVHYMPGTFHDPRYYPMSLPVTYAGEPAPDGIKFVFTNDEGGTVEAISRDGYVSADLVEDTDYTVHVKDDEYDISTFALTVKDKSEHKYLDTLGKTSSYKRYCYDHTCCQGVSSIILTGKGSARIGKITSLKTDAQGQPLATVSGIDFKTLLLLVRYPSIELPADSGIADYDAVELTLVNPHRWEKCKITDTEFTVSAILPQKRTVKQVYELRKGILEKVIFSQEDKETVTFTTDSMSLYPIIIEYADTKNDNNTAQQDQTSSATDNKQAVNKKKVSLPKKTSIRNLRAGKKKLTVIWKKQTVRSQGYEIQYSLKKNFSKAKKVTVRGNKKTKKVIKGLKRGRRYYVRIRTYRRVDGKTYASAWSKTRSAKIR